MKSVLIAHSDPSATAKLESALIGQGLGAITISDGAGAVEFLKKQPVLAVMAEQNLPKVNGMDLLTHLKVRHPESKFVMMSPDSSAQSARMALTAGAFDYLIEPFTPDDVISVLQRLLETAGNGSRRAASGTYDHIIGQSRAINDVFRLVDKVAATDSTVMIYGESGTGKELVARAIHNNSLRSERALVPVNCGAIPEELLESELFGHEKGAFTSAIRTRIGRFEMSDGGTIFLDEIADMSPKLQVKILRVLQEHQFERIGGGKTINVDIRVITASNKNLRQAMEQGRFREDLFYRLNVIPITVPPLRERAGDVPLLAEHFLQRFRATKNGDVRSINQEAMSKLMSYDWPGNIRELENIIERMIILAEDHILAHGDLPPRIAQVETKAECAASPEIKITDEGIDFNRLVSEFEDKLLIQALEKAGWVKNKAAKFLGINRTTLVEKLKKKKITQPGS